MAFTLSLPLQQIDGVGYSVDQAKVPGGDLIRFMCRPLTPEETAERIERLFGDEYNEPWPGVQRYRCIYFDEDSKLCTIYDHRPDMCRDYPYPLSADFHTSDPTAGVCDHGCGCQGSPLIGETMD